MSVRVERAGAAALCPYDPAFLPKDAADALLGCKSAFSSLAGSTQW